MLIKFSATLPNPKLAVSRWTITRLQKETCLPAGLASSVQLVSNRREKKNERGIRKVIEV